MKKYSTSEDLANLTVSIPVDLARDLLVLAQKGASEATLVISKATELKISIGPLQKAALDSYVNSCKFLRDAISNAIEDNVSHGDQNNIKAYEEVLRKKLIDELVVGFSERIKEAHDCPDTDCNSCDNIRNVFDSEAAQSIKDEFDLTDLPEGSMVVPGNKEEN